MGDHHSRTSTRSPLRSRVLGAAFQVLYRSRTLYWLASTIPFAGQWRVWQRRVLPRVVGSDILEVGCGIGSLLGDLVSAGYRCQAVDASPQMVAAARSELRRRGLTDRDVTVTLARVQALPFADAAFDTVISTFPAPYIYDPRATCEIARVLRPGGRAIVVEGATLLPATPLLLPLAAFQALVYGRRLAHAVPGMRSARDVLTEELPVKRSAIPLESAGLRCREERDRHRLWELYVTIGEKPTAGAVDEA